MSRTAAESSVSASWAASPPAVAAARRFTAQAMRAWQVEDDTGDAVVLIASELATNAVLHAGTSFTLTLGRQPGSVLLCLEDGGVWSRATVRRPVSGRAERGRGLLVVETLASEWGMAPGPERGTQTWARLGTGP